MNAAICCLAALILLPGLLQAGESKQLSVSGIVKVIAPDRIIIVGPGDQECTVVPAEDFTTRVAVGSRVTAWYALKGGVNRLTRLQYAMENDFVSPDLIRLRIKKVVIFPHPGVPDSMGIIDEITRYLEANMGWYIAPSSLAEELEKRFSQTPLLDAFDPATGQFDMSHYQTSGGWTMADLAEQARVDAVVDIRVEEVRAPFAHGVAEWDDMAESIATRSSVILSPLMALTDRGQVPAATVVMNLYDKQGRILWNRQRGFAVLEVRAGGTGRFRDRPLKEVYQDEDNVHEWLAQTFTNLVR
jgi:hypothetical protein